MLAAREDLAVRTPTSLLPEMALESLADHLHGRGCNVGGAAGLSQAYVNELTADLTGLATGTVERGVPHP